jgi:hypothetical protein
MVLVSVVFFFFEKMIDGHIKADEATALILMLIVFLIAARRYIIAKIVALVIISLFFYYRILVFTRSRFHVVISRATCPGYGPVQFIYNIPGPISQTDHTFKCIVLLYLIKN